jgi:hypothetical protein
VKEEWSPLVLDRVLEIARCIAKDNRDAAERWVNELSCAGRVAKCNVTGYVSAHDPEFQAQRPRAILPNWEEGWNPSETRGSASANFGPVERVYLSGRYESPWLVSASADGRSKGNLVG